MTIPQLVEDKDERLIRAKDKMSDMKGENAKPTVTDNRTDRLKNGGK